MSSSPDPFGVNANAPVVANPYAPTVHVSSLTEGLDDVETYRRTYLNHEASVKSIGFLYLLGAIFLVPVGVFVLIGAVGVVANAPAQGNAETLLVVVIGVFYLALGVFQGFVGYGLRRLQPWSRIAGSVLSAIGLIGFPIGTIISAYFLYLLVSKKGKVVFSPEYQSVIEQTPHIKYKVSIVVWILLGLLAALILTGLIFAVLSN